KVELGKSVALMGAGGIGFDVAEYITHEGKSTALDTSAFMKEWGVDMQLDARGCIEVIKADKPNNPREVYLLQRKSTKVGAGLGKTTGWVHRFTLRNKNVKMINGVEYKRIDDHGLHYTKKDKTTVLDVDHVVICAGQVSNTDLFEDIKKINPNVQLIGGAFKAAELDAKEAINQAVRMAAVI
ncbi:MAG: FAD-dependent oxidoreductase, partial [Bacteroidota bacterium]|nr:FAD-dependent oxidoreductase [Bacteroidota bacterium]